MIFVIGHPLLHRFVMLFLGWLYHITEQLGDKNRRESLAVHYLKESLAADNGNGQTWYLLGRFVPILVLETFPQAI